MAATIGIKIANGEFYSIVEENSPGKKRLILTTVHDKQRSVQIDLYKSFTRTMADALYIGSLVVENIKTRPKGEPSIELIISSGGDATISAEAIDMDPSAGKESQYLNVSLKSLDEDSRDVEIPDFELEEPELPPAGLYGKAEAINRSHDKQKPMMWPVLIGAVLILLGLCFGLWYLLTRGNVPAENKDAPLSLIFREDEPAAHPSTAPIQEAQAAPEPAPAEPVPVPTPEPSSPSEPSATAEPETADAPVQEALPPVETESAPAEPEPVAEPAVEPEPEPALEPAPPEAPPVIEAPEEAPVPVKVTRTRPVPPVRSYRVPATIPRNGAPYRIRWGDTLWDIAEAFYRNPWLYPRIARFNNIRNPDFIISGRTIRIPPGN